VGLKSGEVFMLLETCFWFYDSLLIVRLSLI